MTCSLFNPKVNAEDELYARIRDDARGGQHRRTLEQMWTEYRPYAPKGFRRKLQFEFHQRWWEMYLTIGLCRLGLAVQSFRRDDRPDLLVEVEDLRIWIEAVAPRVGTASDRVPESMINGVQDFPKRECLLRLAQGVTTKRDCLAAYLDAHVVLPQDACVIALSACDLNQFGPLLDWPQPAPLSILAGAGKLAIPLDRSRLPYSSRQEAILRNSGSSVDTALFEKEEYSIISAVLYSNCDPLNASSTPETTFSLFLNPRTNVKLPTGVSRMVETWHEDKRSSTEIVWTKTQPTGPPDR